jgi:hypothetical protein
MWAFPIRTYQIIDAHDHGHRSAYLPRRTRGQESADRGYQLSLKIGQHSITMTLTPKEKLYRYVDETGQDAASSVFVVVVVVSAENQDVLRQALINIEEVSRRIPLRLFPDRGGGIRTFWRSAILSITRTSCRLLVIVRAHPLRTGTFWGQALKSKLPPCGLFVGVSRHPPCPCPSRGDLFGPSLEV